MNENNVGEFEELVLLTVLILREEAYILKIQQELLSQANRKTAMGALHVTLGRLEKKGFVKSHLGEATAERGGRAKRYFEVTSQGKSALKRSRNALDTMWQDITLSSY